MLVRLLKSLFAHVPCNFIFILALLLVSFFSKAQQAQVPLYPKGFSGAKNDTAMIGWLNRTATHLAYINPDSALLLANEAGKRSKELGYNLGLAHSLLTLATIYQAKSSYTNAATTGLQALKLYEQLGDKASMGATYVSLAMVYKEMGGNDRTSTYTKQAISYSYQAYNLYAGIADTAGIVNSLSLRGILYRDKAINQHAFQFYDTAFNAYTKAIQLATASGKGNQYFNKLYNNISQVYTEQRKEYDVALKYLFKAVAINQQNNNSISLSYNYGNISEAYLLLKQPALGLQYAQKMLAVARQTDRPNRMLNGLLQMYRANDALKRYDSALFYYKAAADLDDSLNSVTKTRQVAELQTRYETEKKETAIRLLHTENQVKNTRIAWLISGLVVVGALAIVLVALYRRVQHQKVQLAAQATRLAVMMKELHHRVKNNLQIVSSLLNMQTYKLHDEESISALKTSGERVQAMSLIHQRLYKKDELTAVNLKEYITDLAESLMQSYGYNHQNFELQVSVEQELMDVDTALPIGLIVNELITNSLKYAYARVEQPALHVSLTSQGSSIRLSVKDNGQDFSEAKWQQGKGSFGKQLIVSLCRQLRAKQTVNTADGTEFVINIPLKAA